MDAFKARLEQYKASTIVSGESSQWQLWELTEILISKINNCNYVSYAEYMSANPSLAKFKGINTNLSFGRPNLIQWSSYRFISYVNVSSLLQLKM